MEFYTLLAGAGIAVETVAVALHRPSDPRERSLLRGYLENEFELFEAYQSTHPKGPEATLKNRAILASFVTKSAGELVFAGLYAQDGWTEKTAAELDAMPIFARLHAERDWSFSKEAAEKGVPGRALFTLTPLPALRDLVGRLVVADPGGRNHMRLAENTALPVLEMTRQEDYAPPMPEWNRLALSAGDIAALPRLWAEKLAAWQGVYLIVDETDGARYVGSACGAENLLGRWRQHVAHDHGATKGLSARNPANFRFSILETLHPGLDARAVGEVENTWKERLHTREFGLNEN